MSRCDLTSRCQPCLVRASFALDAELVGAVQDVYGVRQGRLDEQLQRHLARTYTSLASVLLALKTAGSTQHVPFRDSQLTQWLRPSLQAASSLLLCHASVLLQLAVVCSCGPAGPRPRMCRRLSTCLDRHR
jgi:hypothetical protein